ncbi:MAG: hypothetical protein H6Q76_359 [Firmicutes bacterium]|nr:hypothetical protein [Bacillota bacterium]
MRFNNQRKAFAALALGFVLTWSAGCASTSSPPTSPQAKVPENVHAMVDVQKVLEAHPKRAELRQMEQELAAAQAKAADKSAAMETARQEYESAMKVRQDEDKAALDKKQRQLGDALNEERRLFVEALEAEYRPQLFNLDLKLQAVQRSPSETQVLQTEKTQLETQRNGKLKAKEDALAAQFQKEMDAFASELAAQTETYANKWMDDRMQQLQKSTVSPEQEKQRQQIALLSTKMIQDVRAAVAKVAVQEKIEIVWIRPAVRQPVKDITDSVVREIANAK